jgi:hypothetical protein
VINSYDFQLAGYSFDLSLCDLKKVKKVTAPLKRLSKALTSALSDAVARSCILLAHWDAQSYWQESYADLYDFCYRLDKRCADTGVKTNEALQAIQIGCADVKRVLEQGDDQLVVRSGTAGPAYQYSHGLSVFFPWSRPAPDSFWPDEYRDYIFSETGWQEFLVQYFIQTMRQPRGSELARGKAGPKPTLDQSLLEEITSPGLNAPGQLSKGGPNDSTGGPKSGATDPTGGPKSGGTDPTGDFAGPAIKNYPAYTREPLVQAQLPAKNVGKKVAKKAPRKRTGKKK